MSYKRQYSTASETKYNGRCLIFNELKLIFSKGKLMNLEGREAVQRSIEEHTINYQEQPTLFKAIPEIHEKIKACRYTKYARSRLEKSRVGDKDILVKIISGLDSSDQTINAILVYTISSFFNQFTSHSEVRAASIIEALARSLLFYYFERQEDLGRGTYSEDRGEADGPIRVGRAKKLYEIHHNAAHPRYHLLGSIALELLCEHNITELVSGKDLDTTVEKKKVIYSASDAHKRLKQSYVRCKINPTVMPIKCNLPMICPPRPWTYLEEQNEDASNNTVCASFYLDGGYLSSNKILSLLRYHFLSSKSLIDFRITRVSKEVLSNINKLQAVGFQNDKYFINFILKNKAKLVEFGIIAPEEMQNIKLRDYVAQKREKCQEGNIPFFYQSEYDSAKKMHDSAFLEQSRLDLCQMLDGLVYYFPAFIDFRGRIYRTGLITPHERELIRGLTCFSWDRPALSEAELVHCKEVLQRFIGYQIKRCSNDNQALAVSKSFLDESGQFRIDKVLQEANHPVLATRAALWYNEGKDLYLCPISIDASSSAYQFIAYLTCNVKLGIQTNLFFDNQSEEIQDLYSILAEELAAYVKRKNIQLPPGIHIDDLTNRKIVKAAYMPLVYGKSAITLSNDILNDFLKNRVSIKEAYQLAKIFYDFTSEGAMVKYKRFLELCSCFAKLCATLDKAVSLNNSLLSIIQDYRQSETTSVYVFDPKIGAKKRISLMYRSRNRNPKKAAQSTPANLVHSLDAYVAQRVISKFTQKFPGVPFYTVHDCFVTSALYVDQLPAIYREAFLELGNPVCLINGYLVENLFSKDLMGKLPLIIDMNKPFTDAHLDTLIEVPEHLDKKRRITAAELIKELKLVYKEFMSQLSPEYIQFFQRLLKERESKNCLHF